ncbi:MAG TPA: UDP-N-acetylmuramate dehydrogenase [Mycobacteriales bacterium]|nr:UDP-N-acetylmuramate dehydrogenase [Mycobacteriales bacterium]
MEVRQGVPLAPLTTLRLGGPASRLVEADSAEAIVAAVRAADDAGEPVLLLGGGSNLVLADAGWPGTAVLLRSRGVAVVEDGDVRSVTVQAGEPWDDLVARAVAEGWAGLECLAGIPGLTGATPVQNVGAYGQEVADTLTGVRAYDRERREVRELPAAECGFGYRTSVFKHSDRYVVLAVTFGLRASDKCGPVRYAELAGALGVEVGGVAPLAEVRDAVLALRRRKGMVVDPADPDTWSVGSFFTNPVLDPAGLAGFEARLEPGTRYPSWPADDGGRKLSAAWLIERSGFSRGHGREAVRVSGKHTLALTHRGGGSTAELVALAREVRDGVRDRFGVTLRAEPRLVGIEL